MVEVFDPARVRFYARATGQRAKTDAVDAAVIAAFTAAQVAPALAPVDPAREELAGLVKARHLLVEKRADLRRARPTAPAVARIALEAAIAALAGTIADLDAAITRQLAEQPAVAAMVQALQSAPGVGPVVAITLAALLPELGRISGERIAALVGVAPYARDSGQAQGLATSRAAAPMSGERSTWPRKSPPPGPPA